MRFSSAIVLAWSLPLVVNAAPVLQARQASQLAASDALVLKFAEVLNQLESKFYSDAIAKFQDSDFTGAGFTVPDIPKQAFQKIQADEQTHINFLSGALKAANDNTVAGCTFDFTPVSTDVKTMSTFARIVEHVGVSAFLGASVLVSDRSILGAAATILTTEARHQTITNVLNGGRAIPQAFDQALTPKQVLTLASPFIKGCDLGIAPNLPVKITNQPAPGVKLEFDLSGIQGDQLFCHMLIGGQPTSSVQPAQNCVVPTGLPDGATFIFISDDMQPLASNVVLQNEAQIKAGPAIVFFDQQPNALGDLVVKNENGNAKNAPSVQGTENSDLKVIGVSTTSV